MKTEDEFKEFIALAFDKICSGRCEEVVHVLLDENDRPEACKLLLIIASDRDHLSRLTERQIRSARAQKRYDGNALAKYLYSRWLLEIKGDPASRSEAAGLLGSISEEVPDAGAALAELTRTGNQSHQAWELYQQSLAKALKKDSMLAGYYRQRDAIAGTDNAEALDAAVRMLKKGIKDQKDWPYGIYFQLLGTAYEKMGMKGEAVKAYKRALTLGHFSAKEELIRLEDNELNFKRCKL